MASTSSWSTAQYRTGDGGIYNCAAGRTAVDILTEAAKGAAAIVCVGTCSSFGGIPLRRSQSDRRAAGVRLDRRSTDHQCFRLPADSGGDHRDAAAIRVHGARYRIWTSIGRPKAFFGNTIHDRCYRRPFYDQGKFAKSFDDEGARNGWCLYELGCKGPTTYNACATVKWNGGTSFPIESGHPCLGCAEPNFWDKGSFYSRPGHAALG